MKEEEYNNNDDVYDINTGTLYHLCKSQSKPVKVCFSEESKGIIRVCPLCYNKLDWDNAEHKFISP